jgi:hypothetical protein
MTNSYLPLLLVLLYLPYAYLGKIKIVEEVDKPSLAYIRKEIKEKETTPYCLLKKIAKTQKET